MRSLHLLDEEDHHHTTITECWVEKMGLTPDVVQSYLANLIDDAKSSQPDRYVELPLRVAVSMRPIVRTLRSLAVPFSGGSR